MRATARLFAAVSQSAPRHLKPGNPTGLTGLLTHPAPRSALIYLYSSVLSKLEKIPESSVYRQATEALTKKNLEIVKAVKPAGYEEWSEKMQWRLSEIESELGEGKLTYDGQRFVLTKMIVKEPDDRTNEFGGLTPFQFIEGAVSADQRAEEAVKLEKWLKRNEKMIPRIDPEPPLTLEQIHDLETKLDSGLIEEVIQIAEGENRLVDVLIEHKAWEDLTEKSPEGQWSYFERSTSDLSSQT